MSHTVEMARSLLQQAPGRGCHCTKAIDASTVDPFRSPRQHHETADDSALVVARLNDRWRVVICKDGIQWILRRRDMTERSGRARWTGVQYFRTRMVLVRASGAMRDGADPVALAALAARIGGTP